MTSETLACSVRDGEKGEKEVAATGKAPEKLFFSVLLRRKIWDTKPVVSFV